MTTEICNSYQMGITVTVIFSYIAGYYCAKETFFCFYFFFFAKEVLSESKIKKGRYL